MENYIGSKIIKAEPLTEHDYFIKHKNRADLIDGENRNGYIIKYPDGYVSWSPKEVFEECYRKISQKEIELIGE